MSGIEQLLVENRVFPPPKKFAKQAAISSMAQYKAMCKSFEKDFDGTWARLAKENLFWKKPFKKVLDESSAPFYKWFSDGTTNASYNCLDKNIKAGLGKKTAIIFESDSGEVTNITYSEFHSRVCQFANGLKSIGVKKGDCVVLYMAMSIEGIVAMQACARIGATHSVVFGGFSAKSLEERIVDVGATVVITADEQMRGGKKLPLKTVVDEALALGAGKVVQHVIVYKRTGSDVPFTTGRDHWMHDLVAGQPTSCEPEWV